MKNLVKLIVTLIIFFILSRYIDFESVFAIIDNAAIHFLVLALLMQFVSTYLASYRWYLIMKRLVFNETLWFYVKSYFKGSFFNQVLPSSIGGDAVRIIELKQHGYEAKEAFYGIFVDRVIGLLGLITLNLFANFAYYTTFPTWLFQLINAVCIAGIIGFILLMNLQKLHFLTKTKATELFYRLSARLNKLYDSKRLLASHLGISMIVHIFTILAIFFLALSVDLHLDFSVFLIAIPPVILLTIVPVSLAGWGVREGAMVGILVLVGANRDEVLAVSLLYGLALIVTSLPGALFWVQSKKHT